MRAAAAHTIATMKAAEEDLRRDIPPPYWYSNPATLDLAIANQPQWSGVVPPPPPALPIPRSAQARERCASIAGVSAVTTRADVCHFRCHGSVVVSSRPEKSVTAETYKKNSRDELQGPERCPIRGAKRLRRGRRGMPCE